MGVNSNAQCSKRGVHFSILVLIAGFFFAVQPIYQPFNLSSFDWQRWVEAFILAFLSLSCVPRLFKLGYILSAFSRNVLLALVVSTVISTFFSQSGWVSWVSLLRFWLWTAILLAFPFIYAAATEGTRRMLACGIMAGLAVYAWYVGFGIFVLANNGVYDRAIAVAGFANVNHAAGFLALAIMILPALSSKMPAGLDFWGRSVALFVAAPLVMLLVIIGSRGSFVGMTMGVLAVVAIAERDAAMVYCKQLSAYMVSGACLYVCLHFIVPDGANLRGRSLLSDNGRLELYELAWEGISTAPVFGHGPFSYAALEYTPLTHPHNFFLTFLYEYGGASAFFGALLLTVLVVYVIKMRTRWKASLDAVAGMAVVIAFVVHSQVSGVAMIPLSIFVFAFAIGLLGAPLVGGAITKKHNSLLCLGLSLIIGSSYLVLVCIYWMELNDTMLTNPRFWLRGELPLGHY